MSRTFTHLTLVLGAMVALAGCSDRVESGSPPGPTTTTTAVVDRLDGLDFAKGSEVELGDDWTIAPCESGPPLFCARHDGETQATVELLSAPSASYEPMKKVLDEGGSIDDALRAEAAEFSSLFEQDRTVGCGADYDVEPFGPDPGTVAGRPGIIHGFDGTQNGRLVERVLQFMTIDDGTVHLISLNAIDEGTCMDDGELSEFTTRELLALESKLVRVVAASTLP